MQCLVHRPTDDRVGLREDDHDRPRARRLYLISSQSVASASPQRTCNGFVAFPRNSESGSFFARRADVVHIGTPRQQVSSDARTEQVVVENEAEDDSVVDALQQDLEPLFVGSAIDPIVVDSGPRQLANGLSPLTAEIVEEPLPAGSVAQLESLVLRPTVAESDTDSLENPSIFGESEVHEDRVGRDAGGPAISEVRVTAAIQLGFEGLDFVDLRDTCMVRAHIGLPCGWSCERPAQPLRTGVSCSL